MGAVAGLHRAQKSEVDAESGQRCPHTRREGVAHAKGATRGSLLKHQRVGDDINMGYDIGEQTSNNETRSILEGVEEGEI